MRVLVVVESHFGNTRAIADEVAQGVADAGGRASVVPVNEAPTQIPADVDVLVVGAPTHSRGLSTAATRRQADQSGGDGAGQGLREWIDTLDFPSTLTIAAFDTTVSKGWFSGSAAKVASTILARRVQGQPGVTVQPPQSFLVGGTKGPLQDGQRQSAHAWGAQLVTG